MAVVEWMKPLGSRLLQTITKKQPEETRFKFIPATRQEVVLTVQNGRLILANAGPDQALQHFIVKTRYDGNYIRQDFEFQPFVQAYPDDNTVGMRPLGPLDNNWDPFTKWEVSAIGWRPKWSNEDWREVTGGVSIVWSDVRNIELLVTVGQAPGKTAQRFMSNLIDQGGNVTLSQSGEPGKTEQWIMRPEYPNYSAEQIWGAATSVTGEWVFGRLPDALPSSSAGTPAMSAVGAEPQPHPPRRDLPRMQEAPALVAQAAGEFVTDTITATARRIGRWLVRYGIAVACGAALTMLARRKRN